MESDLAASAGAMRATVAVATEGLIERDTLVELLLLGAVAGEHLLVVGPPGTAKSEAVRRVARTLGARYFEYLLGRFTEPSEIFGPVDLQKLREGIVETRTAGMLPECEIAFLDEVFLGSTAILNTLLGILNERVFRRGHTSVRCPLRLCVGASNALPEDESLAAFADRFLLRTFLTPLPDPRLEELLEGGWGLGNAAVPAHAEGSARGATMSQLDALHAAVPHVDLSGLRPVLAHALRLLRNAGIPLTDRRAVRAQRVVAAAAVLDGRTRATTADLWPLVYVAPTAEAQELARETLRPLLRDAASGALGAASLEASQGPAARAARLEHAGVALLEGAPATRDDTEAWERWRLRLEGVVREIDAGFAASTMPPSLAQVRARVLAALAETGTAA